MACNKAQANSTINVLDKWVLTKLDATIAETTAKLEIFNYAAAKKEVNKFFWFFVGNYLEFVKYRVYGRNDGAASATLKRVLLTVLKLYAPFMPYITEEIYQKMFTAQETARSIHKTEWPTPTYVESDKQILKSGDDIQRVVEFIRLWKHQQGLALNAPLKEVILTKSNPDIEDAISGIMEVNSVHEGPGTTPILGSDIKISIRA